MIDVKRVKSYQPPSPGGWTIHEVKKLASKVKPEPIAVKSVLNESTSLKPKGNRLRTAVKAEKTLPSSNGGGAWKILRN